MATWHRVGGALATATLVFILAACGGGGGPTPAPPAGDTTPPSVLTTSPAAGASGVAATTTLLVTFSESIDPSTLTTASFSVAAAGSAVAGSVAASGPVATFTPAVPLAAGTSFVVTISTAVKDSAGNPLAAAHGWSFATAATLRSWSMPVPLELADGAAGQASVAAAMDDDPVTAAVQATAVWVQHDGTQPSIYASRLSGGVWQGPTLLENDTVVGGASAGGVSAPRVRMGALGRAVTTWIRDNGNASYSIWAYAHDQPAVAEPARLIGGGGTASDPQVSFDDDGHDAFAVWTEYDSGRAPPAFRITQRQFLYAACDLIVNCAWNQNDFGWRSTTLIETAAEDAISPQVSGFGHRNAVAVWGKAQGAVGLELWAADHAFATDWGIPVRVNTSANRVEKWAVAAAPDGSATAVWIESVAGRRTLFASRLGSAGWSAPQALDDPAGSQADEPQVVVDRNGNALVAWIQFVAGAWSVQARRCPPGPLSGCTAVARVVGPAGNAEQPRLAGSPGGDAMVVWLQADAAGQRGLYASGYTAAGGWAASADRVDAGGGMAGARVAIDKAGIATLVWSKFDAAGKQSIYASRYR